MALSMAFYGGLLVLMATAVAGDEVKEFVLLHNDDDVEERHNGKMNMNSPDLELSSSKYGVQIVGLRYKLDLPKGAVATDVRVKFESEESRHSGLVEIDIAFGATPNAKPFLSNDRHLSNLALGKPLHWVVTDTWREGEHYSTPNLASGLNAVLSNPGYAPGNYVSILFKRHGPDGTNRRDAWTKEGNLHGPVLEVFFKEAGPCVLPAIEATLVSSGGTGVAIPAVSASEGMNGWTVGAGTTTLTNLPPEMKTADAVAFFPPQTTPLPADTTLKLSCPKGCKNEACEFYITMYHCPVCSGKTNGKFPALLPVDGWDVGSCAPVFNLAGSKYPMTTFRRVVPAGSTYETPPTLSPLVHFGIFATPFAAQCGLNTLEGVCDSAPSCQWRAGSCQTLWCPRRFGPYTKNVCTQKCAPTN